MKPATDSRRNIPAASDSGMSAWMELPITANKDVVSRYHGQEHRMESTVPIQSRQQSERVHHRGGENPGQISIKGLAKQALPMYARQSRVVYACLQNLAQ